MTIDRGAPEALYEQLAGILREQIRTGQLPVRTRIPSIDDLAAEHDLAPVTVRHALDLLKGEGLIQSRSGRGTFVIATP